MANSKIQPLYDYLKQKGIKPIFICTCTYSLSGKAYTEVNNKFILSAPTLEKLQEKILAAYKEIEEDNHYYINKPLNIEALTNPKGDYPKTHFEFEYAWAFGPYCNYCLDIQGFDTKTFNRFHI